MKKRGMLIRSALLILGVFMASALLGAGPALAQSLTVNAPAAGATIPAGHTRTILWSTTGDPGANVSIDLYKAGVFWKSVSAGTPNDGEFAWDIDLGEMPGTDYTLHLASVTLPAVTADSGLFTIVPYVPTVTAPQGGEEWGVGASHLITWLSEDFPLATTVSISIESLSLETTYQIATGVPNTGAFPWSIPSDFPLAADYMVTIIPDIGDMAMSDNTFTIKRLAPAPGASITVLSPSSVGAVAAGHPQIVRWTTTGITDATLAVELYKGGVLMGSIADDPLTVPVETAVPNTGEFVWYVDADVPPGTDYSVRIASTVVVAAGFSEVFTIQPYVPTITSPRGAVPPNTPPEQWMTGTSHTITWLKDTYFNSTGVNIELLDPSGTSTIALNVPNNGIFPWYIPTELPTGTSYKVKVTGLNDICDLEGCLFDLPASSDNYFQITLGSAPPPPPVGNTILVVSPAANKAVVAGHAQTILWTTTGVTGADVEINLYKNSAPLVPPVVISASTPNDGEFSWAVPADLVPGIDYTIHVKSTTALPVVEDWSDNFTVKPYVPTVIAPMGGEVWQAGTAHPIEWLKDDFPGSTRVTIALEGPTPLTIAALFPNVGYFPWVVPYDIIPGTSYKILITPVAETDVAASSDNFFTITQGALQLASPDGGETWAAGSTHAITWSSNLDPGSAVRIELLKNGVLAATIVDSVLAELLSFSWAIPFDQEPGTDYRVRILSLDNPDQYDLSAAEFEITSPAAPGDTLAVVYPAGGETLGAGHAHTLLWTSTGNPGENVRIELYKGGAPISAPGPLVIAASTPNDGEFVWDVPPGQAPGVDYTIHVSSVETPAVTDDSDAFAIVPYVPTVTSPAGGESWWGGTEHVITWQERYVAGTTVDISLATGPDMGAVHVIAKNVPNIGSFPWIIPPSVPSGAEYRVVIFSVAPDGEEAASDNYFSIMQNALRVVAPNGGESWTAGSAHDVTWSNEGGVAGDVRIDLYKGGLLNSVIVESTPVGGGTYAWTLPVSQEPGEDYRVRITSLDDPSLYASSFSDFAITASAPTDIALSNASVLETAAIGTKVGALSTTDADFGDSFTYALVDGAGSVDNSLFAIAAGNELRTAALYDFDVQSSFSIRVRSTDLAGRFFEKVFIITLRDFNLAPTDVSLSAATVPENRPLWTLVGTLGTTDADFGDAFTYTLVSGAGSADNDSFAISGSDLTTAAVLDFEAQSAYAVRVRTTDQGGLWYERSFAITATDVNESPTEILLVGTAVAEGLPAPAPVGVFSSADPDAGETFTYALVGGAGSDGNASFSIAAGVLQTAAILNYSARSSYSIRVRSTDLGGLFTETVFTIGVTNVMRAPTDIALSAATVAENAPAGTVIGTVSATDPDPGDTFTFALTGGVGGGDNALFQITGDEFGTAAVLDFEERSSYSIRVRATDQDGQFYDEIFTVTATNVNEAPTALLIVDAAVPEGAAPATEVGVLSTTDPDAGDTFVYTLVGGAGSDDNASFSFAGSSLLTAAVFNFDLKSGYSIRVRSTDAGGLFREEVLAISVTNVMRRPTDIVLSGATVDEGAPLWTLVGSLSSADPDAGDTFTYTLVPGAGSSDNALFAVYAEDLVTAAVLDFETRSDYFVRLRTTDQDGKFYEEAFTITVADVFENARPTDIALSATSVLEGKPMATVVGAFGTTDPDEGDTFTYTLVAGVGGADNGSFTISAAGVLLTAEVFDYDVKNSYSIRVRSTDLGGLYKEKVFAITVLKVTQGPTDIALSAATVPEAAPLSTLIGTFSSTDPDVGDTFTYALVPGAGSADNAFFAVSGNQLITAAVLDFEVRSTYTIRVRSTDAAGEFYEEAFTITVTDVPENSAPTDLALSAATVAENAPLSTLVGALSTTDPNAGNTFTYTLVSGAGSADNALFTISGSDLITAAALDFEAGGTRYVRVRTTDQGGLWYEEALTITVTNVNEAPTDIVLVGATVPEAQPAGTKVGDLTSADPDAGSTFTYTLVGGVGSDDNALFQTAGAQLQTAAVLNFGVDNSYSVRVRTTDGGGLFFEEVFTITVVGVPDAIMLTSPNGGESWQAGTVHTISWNSEGSVGALVRIDLYDGAVLNRQIALSADNDGAYGWTINAGQSQGTNYRIRVTSLDDPAVFGQSAGAFTITVSPSTDIALSGNNVNRDDAIGTVVGILSTVPDLGDTYAYTLVDGTGSTDNSKFRIVGDELQTNIPFTDVPGTTCTVRVRSTASSSGTSVERAFIINLLAVNLTPTGLTLNNSTVVEHRPLGTRVGVFSAVDSNPGDTHVHELAAGTGDTHNALFQISADELQTAASLDQGSYSIRMRTTDQGGLWYERPFTITVTANHAPVLAAIGLQFGTEGEELCITPTATDVDGDELTYGAAPLPAGATFDGQTFCWPSPGPEGNYFVTFSVSDGDQSDSELVTITIEAYSPMQFFDDFTDGNASGDPEWVKVSGTWTVSSARRYVGKSTKTMNISTPRQDLVPILGSGRVQTKVRMKSLAAAPNAMLVFSYLSPKQYRFVKLVPGGIRLGQVEPFGGSNANLTGANVTAKTGTLYDLQADLYPDGRVTVYLQGNPVLTWTFPTARAGAVGVGVKKNGAEFDDFGVSDDSVLP